MRPEAMTFAGRHLLKGWTVVDRLGEITVPTLIVAGRTTSSSAPGTSANSPPRSGLVAATPENRQQGTSSVRVMPFVPVQTYGPQVMVWICSHHRS